MEHGMRLAWTGLVLIAVGMVPSLLAVGELTDGLAELPRHWWSSFAVLPMVAGFAVTSFGLVRLSKRAG